MICHQSNFLPLPPSIPSSLEQKDRETLWMTLLCLAGLEIHMATEKDVWAMMADKAWTWIRQTLSEQQNSAELEKLIVTLQDKAREVISS
jgi:hypothetical protein